MLFMNLGNHTIYQMALNEGFPFPKMLSYRFIYIWRWMDHQKCCTLPLYHTEMCLLDPLAK